jgi:hypothetical protein
VQVAQRVDLHQQRHQGDEHEHDRRVAIDEHADGRERLTLARQPFPYVQRRDAGRPLGAPRHDRGAEGSRGAQNREERRRAPEPPQWRHDGKDEERSYR